VKSRRICSICDKKYFCHVLRKLELKFHETIFEITKTYATQLLEKIEIFKTKTRTKKNVFLTIVSAYGVKKNEYYLNVITNQLLLEDLF
jgi:hypothetical protein